MNEKEKFAEAVERMKMMKLDESLVINQFIKGTVKVSERLDSLFLTVLFNVDNYDYLMDVINDFEKKHNVLVYHVQLSHTDFGDCYSLLYVSSEKEEWNMDRDDIKIGYPLAYVWNKTIPEYSEFGYIGVRPSMGGLERIS